MVTALVDNAAPGRNDLRMWISGRRAFRPDSQYYRNVRRGRRSRGRLHMSLPFWLSTAVVALVGCVWMLRR